MTVLRLLRTNHLISGALLIFYAALVRSVVFILHPWEKVPDGGGPLADLMYHFSGSTGLIPEIVSIGIIYINALIINYLVARNFLAKEINLFPGLFYIIVSSSVPDFLGLSSLHIANSFLLMACFSVFEIYKKNSVAKYIFNAGILIGISSLFFLPYAIFFLWLVVAVNSLHGIKLSYIFMGLTGLIIPWFYTFLYAYWVGETEQYFNSFILEQIGFLQFDFGKSLIDLLPLSIFAFLVLVALAGYNSSLSKKKFEEKKKINLLYWLIFFGGIVLLFCTPATPEHLVVLTIPVGVLLSFGFTRMKPPFDGLYHFLLLIFVVGMHYLKFLDVI